MRDKEVSNAPLAPDKLCTTADKILVIFAQEGIESAYVELCIRHSKMAIRMIRRIVRNEEDAEDVLQESILKAYLLPQELQRTRKVFDVFARISVSSALALLRRKSQRSKALDGNIDTGVEKWVHFADKGPNPEQLLVQAECVWQVKQAIWGLPPALQDVFVLRHFAEFSVAEVAERSGLSVAATKSRLARARRELASKIGDSRFLLAPRGSMRSSPTAQRCISGLRPSNRSANPGIAVKQNRFKERSIRSQTYPSKGQSCLNL